MDAASVADAWELLAAHVHASAWIEARAHMSKLSELGQREAVERIFHRVPPFEQLSEGQKRSVARACRREAERARPAPTEEGLSEQEAQLVLERVRRLVDRLGVPKRTIH